jgi:hypothetical protein
MKIRINSEIYQFSNIQINEIFSKINKNNTKL